MGMVKFIFGMFLAALTDIACGFLFAHLTIKLFGLEPIFFIYGIGVIFSILPDCDGVVQRFTLGRIMADHRHWPHYPIIILPVFSIFCFFSFPMACLISVCLFAHFIHDSLDFKENGNGIKWLAPFKQNQYCISMGRFGVAIKKLKEKRKTKKYKETIEDWLEKYYLDFTPNAIFGVVMVFIVGLIAFLW